jgi:trehalose 6-phosphate phosphatase
MPANTPLPALTRDCAVFLDVDGTLLDIAATPAAVEVPAGLPALLHALTTRQNGAFALISGRPVCDLDHFFGTGLALAAEHGAVLRDAAGKTLECVPPPAELEAIADKLRAAIRGQPGVLLERKQFGIVLHWRNAPEAAARLRALAKALIVAQPSLQLQPAHEAIEIHTAGAGKGSALAQFMQQAPFAGRVPLFVGDDVTDEPAIAAARRLGGIGLHMAPDFGGSPARLRAWLAQAIAGGND